MDRSGREGAPRSAPRLVPLIPRAIIRTHRPLCCAAHRHTPRCRQPRCCSKSAADTAVALSSDLWGSRCGGSGVCPSASLGLVWHGTLLPVPVVGGQTPRTAPEAWRGEQWPRGQSHSGAAALTFEHAGPRQQRPQWAQGGATTAPSVEPKSAASERGSRAIQEVRAMCHDGNATHSWIHTRYRNGVTVIVLHDRDPVKHFLFLRRSTIGTEIVRMQTVSPGCHSVKRRCRVDRYDSSSDANCKPALPFTARPLVVPALPRRFCAARVDPRPVPLSFPLARCSAVASRSPASSGCPPARPLFPSLVRRDRLRADSNATASGREEKQQAQERAPGTILRRTRRNRSSAPLQRKAQREFNAANAAKNEQTARNPRNRQIDRAVAWRVEVAALLPHRTRSSRIFGAGACDDVRLAWRGLELCEPRCSVRHGSTRAPRCSTQRG